MLPYNIIIQEAGEGKTEAALIDPIASLMAIQNPKLASIANKVRAILRKVIENI